MKIFLISIAGIFFFCSHSFAQKNRRQSSQRERVNLGIKDGDLSTREMKVLIAEQKKIERIEVRAKADGFISPREKKKIERAKERAIRNLQKKLDKRRK